MIILFNDFKLFGIFVVVLISLVHLSHGSSSTNSSSPTIIYCPRSPCPTSKLSYSNPPVTCTPSTIYPSHCTLLKHHCLLYNRRREFPSNQDANSTTTISTLIPPPTIVPLNHCTLSSGHMKSCNSKCNGDFDPVCGSDGVTYRNMCELFVEKCKKSTSPLPSHPGSCITTPVIIPRESCPVNCIYAPIDGPVCASNGNVYKSTCEMKLKTCGLGVTRTSLHHCPTTKHCHDNCWKISKPTCGSDGVVYPNGCSMRKRNCGKYIYEQPLSYCIKRQAQRVLYNCPTETISCDSGGGADHQRSLNSSESMVCGSDGNIYENECELRKLNCGQKNAFVSPVEFEHCQFKFTKCNQLLTNPSCTENESPEDFVCGSDGRTYRNQCELNLAICRKGIHISHYGTCVDASKISEAKSVPCEEKVKACVESSISRNQPVCANDGNVYSSPCTLLASTNCSPHIMPINPVHCPTTEYCNVSCPKAGNYVCASDMKLYRNYCEMKAKNCGTHIYQIPITRCLMNFKYTDNCKKVCSNEWFPICGSDGKTYGNACLFSMEVCRRSAKSSNNNGQQKGVRKLHDGKCGSTSSGGAEESGSGTGNGVGDNLLREFNNRL